jgi:hypothetical protein
MVKKLAIISLLVLGACHPLPEYRDFELPQNPTAVEHKPLTVPHRAWLEQGCWFRSENGHDVKVCK